MAEGEWPWEGVKRNVGMALVCLWTAATGAWGAKAPAWEGGSFMDRGDGWLGQICLYGECMSAGAAMLVVKIALGRCWSCQGPGGLSCWVGLLPTTRAPPRNEK